MTILAPFLLVILSILINIFLSVTKIKRESLLGLNLLFWLFILLSFFIFKNELLTGGLPDFAFRFISLSQFELIFCVVISVLVMIFFASSFYGTSRDFRPEMPCLANLAAFGMMGMSFSAELITTLIFLEIASISVYAMIAINQSSRAIESALKYFLLSSFMSAFYLLGAALIFGSVGSTKYSNIERMFEPSFIVVSGVMLVVSMMFFKIAIFGFYRWSIDVYYGANIAISGLLASAFKLASFAMLINFALLYRGEWGEFIATIFAIVAIFSMFIGNFLSLKESDVKKILIAAGIVHSGYVFINLASATDSAQLFPALFYLSSYCVVVGFAFMILNAVFGEQKITISSLNGLYASRPFAALALTIICLSFIGFPYTVGFLGKLYLFSSAVESKKTYLAVFGIINTILSVYYYLKIMISIYFNPQPSPIILSPKKALWLRILTILAIVFIVCEGSGALSILHFLDLVIS